MTKDTYNRYSLEGILSLNTFLIGQPHLIAYQSYCFCLFLPPYPSSAGVYLVDISEFGCNSWNLLWKDCKQI